MDPCQKAEQYCYSDLIDLVAESAWFFSLWERSAECSRQPELKRDSPSYGAIYSLHFERYTAMLVVYEEKKTCPDP